MELVPQHPFHLGSTGMGKRMNFIDLAVWEVSEEMKRVGIGEGMTYKCKCDQGRSTKRESRNGSKIHTQ